MYDCRMQVVGRTTRLTNDNSPSEQYEFRPTPFALSLEIGLQDSDLWKSRGRKSWSRISGRTLFRERFLRSIQCIVYKHCRYTFLDHRYTTHDVVDTAWNLGGSMNLLGNPTMGEINLDWLHGRSGTTRGHENSSAPRIAPNGMERRESSWGYHDRVLSRSRHISIIRGRNQDDDTAERGPHDEDSEHDSVYQMMKDESGRASYLDASEERTLCWGFTLAGCFSRKKCTTGFRYPPAFANTKGIFSIDQQGRVYYLSASYFSDPERCCTRNPLTWALLLYNRSIAHILTGRRSTYRCHRARLHRHSFPAGFLKATDAKSLHFERCSTGYRSCRNSLYYLHQTRPTIFEVLRRNTFFFVLSTRTLRRFNANTMAGRILHYLLLRFSLMF